MPCFKPLTAWYSKEVNKSGRRPLVFDRRDALEPDNEINVGCGQCVGCRLDRSRMWAIRCVHEAQLHDNNCFITLTFNDSSLYQRDNPASLDLSEFQRFMKRLRKKYVGKNPYDKNTQKQQFEDWQFYNGIRFFHCGEYGDLHGRPHYHAILFGHDFSDRELFTIRNGHRLYRSAELESLWPFGFSSVGDCTFESAAYVARYIMKKVTGEHAWHHYSDIDFDTGEILNKREPEYTTMSRNPGIASRWLKQYVGDCYPSDFITVNGKKMKLPKYYDKLAESLGVDMEAIKDDRKLASFEHVDNNTPDRLAVREQVVLNRLTKLPRNLESSQCKN